MCLGYAAQDPGLKPRLPTKVVLHQEQYQPLDQGELKQYDQLLSAYYTERTGGKLNTTFSEHIEKTLNKEARPHLLNYLQQRGLMTR
jgi:nitroreductase